MTSDWVWHICKRRVSEYRELTSLRKALIFVLVGTYTAPRELNHLSLDFELCYDSSKQLFLWTCLAIQRKCHPSQGSNERLPYSRRPLHSGFLKPSFLLPGDSSLDSPLIVPFLVYSNYISWEYRTSMQIFRCCVCVSASLYVGLSYGTLPTNSSWFSRLEHRRVILDPTRSPVPCTAEIQGDSPWFCLFCFILF